MQAERRVLEAKREFVHVLRLTKEKIARSEKERIEDFKDALHAFLEGMIERQKERLGDYQQTLLGRVGSSVRSPEETNGA